MNRKNNQQKNNYQKSSHQKDNHQKSCTMEPRMAVWKILYGVLEEQQYSHVELQRIFREHPELSSRDRAFVERIVRGTLEHLYELDALIGYCSRLPVKKLKPHIRTILRMSVYQLKYMDSVPARAVCNEAVHLANRLGFASLRSYVNGVLRNLSRSLEEGFTVYGGSMEPEEKLSLQYSMPRWILKRYLHMFGEADTIRLLQAQMEPVRLSVYRNPMVFTKEELKRELIGTGADCEELPFGLDGFYISSVSGPEQMPAFQQGAFLIQDVSSMLQGKVTAAGKDHYVMDVCAAPGGKTFHAAMDMKGSGCVDCADVSETKTALIQENAERLKLPNVKISVRDAAVFDASLVERADILIADLPCSGLGIIGRKPEIRYNITEKDVQSLAALQRKILDTVWRYVKPGGRLIYSTCTLTEEEDEENYRYLTEKLPFEPESLKPYFPQGPEADTLEKGYIKLIPGIHPCDGFFIGSAVRRRNEE
ncbi:MAG: 16S rRNA (cytosine(967)-C(5))-methyltransferase RsmB [Lachnospiraceae bacterium]|nr:16S rRNA (cytosine(967)-C(5))-methyltransferase RsmB [Lachnospiraceae bacterium]MDY4970665.1 16S rRNA (cytosine(967)-C(5))-methyltransferase RsmB [Lachnospiraceae bacterium]